MSHPKKASIYVRRSNTHLKQALRNRDRVNVFAYLYLWGPARLYCSKTAPQTQQLKKQVSLLFMLLIPRGSVLGHLHIGRSSPEWTRPPSQWHQGSCGSKSRANEAAECSLEVLGHQKRAPLGTDRLGFKFQLQHVPCVRPWTCSFFFMF